MNFFDMLLLLETTECVTDLYLQREWGSIENWLKPEAETPLGNSACPNLTMMLTNNICLLNVDLMLTSPNLS